ncbi:hypothetical protein V1264_008601 [Littorina saxatilis]
MANLRESLPSCFSFTEETDSVITGIISDEENLQETLACFERATRTSFVSWHTSLSEKSKPKRVLWSQQGEIIPGCMVPYTVDQSCVRCCSFGPKRPPKTVSSAESDESNKPSEGTGLQETDAKKSSKKVGCPAKLYWKKVTYYPDYDQLLDASRSLKELQMSRLKDDLDFGNPVSPSQCFIVELPLPPTHQFHNVSVQTAQPQSVQERRMAQLTSTNLSLDPSSTCHHAKVIHPGLPPQAIDRFGNPSTMSLVMLARMARQVAMATRGHDGRCFMETDRLREGHITFMAASQYNINSCAYEPEENKYPLHVTLTVGHVGRTSFSVVTDITLPSGHVMLTVINQIILIDPTTRRPTQLPDHWREHYGPLCVRKQPLIVPKQSPPDNATIGDLPYHRMTVAWSDTDDQHTNYTSYIRFALDALYPGLRKG